MSKEILIESEIYDELEKSAKELGYKTVDDYVTDITRKYLKKLEGEAK